MTKQADTLINARWVIPVEPAHVTLPHHSVVVSHGRIVDVLPQRDASEKYVAAETLDLPNHILIPGLVNAHCHAAMSLMRGMADDLPLMDWLQGAIWPAEARHASHSFVKDGTLLAAAEMLRGGVTTCNDMYFYPDAAAQSFDQLGMRAVIGMVVIDFPSAYAATTDAYFTQGLDARDRWKESPLIQFAVAPHAPYTTSDETLSRSAALAAELDIPIHIHIHETAHEITESVARHGRRPLARLHELGLLGPGFIGVHGVHLDSADIALLQRHDASVVHCPTSNMKLASGAAPITELLAAGVNVALGSDGAASNNRLDLLQEMRHAALLAKVTSSNAAALPAHQALHSATLGGAKALGLADRIGSLVSGKEADISAICIDDYAIQPCFDPASHLVYVLGREHVSHVWVGGKPLVIDRKVLQIDNNELSALAAVWHNRIVESS